MRFNWRVSAAVAVAAFLLSLLTGIISGVPFGTLIARALLGAVVFAGVAAGISFVTDRYLPGLGQTEGGNRSDDEDRPGGRVDIVVDGTMYDEGEPGDFERGAGEAESADEEEIAELEVAGEDEEPEELEELTDTASPESLPDIEGLSGSFAETPIELDQPPDAGGTDEGPGMMARAIRTVLKREE